ncbi:MAG: glycosyltransferase [Planctomycetota bacterium]
MSASIGIVAIGRNEGERLVLCLASIAGRADTVVYVDSASTDGSRERARTAGAHVIELDLTRPFTAARARNAGFEALLSIAPATELVQFVDGDCELDSEWISRGVAVLSQRPDAAVVCGRRRERARDASIFNRLCDIEWDTPIGVARACGGDALMRTAAVRAAGGYDDAMIAGEEPDLCLRLRRAGHTVLRIDAEMTRHDAAMTRWTQWWQRAVRTGHTTAELLAKYGASPDHDRFRRARSALVWAVVLPALTLAALVVGMRAAWPAATLVLLVVLAYRSLLQRIARHGRIAGRSAADARAYAWSCALAKWPETWGMTLYVLRRASGRRARWIEYKDAPLAVGPVERPAWQRTHAT